MALLLAAAPGAPVGADDGNLTHRLRVDQRRSSLEQKLERIRARERATRRFDPSTFTVERPEAPPGYHGSQRLRLSPAAPGGVDPPDATRLRTDSRDAEALAVRRQHQLHQDQDRRALRAGTARAGQRPGRADFETRKRQRQFRTEQRSGAFHRKLMR